MKFAKSLVIILSAFLLLNGFLWFDSPEVRQRKKDLKAFVTKAYDYYNKNGEEVAFKEFQNKDGQFVKGEYYIFAFDMNGVCLVHPINSKLVGRDLSKLKDSKKKPFIQAFIDTMKKSKTGWVDYHWTHPESKKIKPKLVYLIKLDDQKFIGCGIYND